MTYEEFYTNVVRATNGKADDGVDVNYLRSLFYINEGKKTLMGAQSKDTRGLEEFVNLTNINDLAMAAIVVQIISTMTLAALNNVKDIIEQRLQKESVDDGKEVLSN